MDLFNTDTQQNLLPFDGEVHYYGAAMSVNKAQEFYCLLLEKIEWQNDKAVIFGKTIITKRKVAWYGEQPFEYTYSNTTKLALPWTKDCLQGTG